MTHEEYLKILDELAIGIAENEDAMEKLKSIRDYGRDAYRDEDVYDENRRRWRDRYDDMRQRYIKRFFGDPETVEETIEERREERREEETGVEVKSIDELFEEEKR